MNRMITVGLAAIVLTLALGSGVYAASKINGSTVKPGSLPGDRVESNSLTGKQVKERSLGSVRRAKQADVAKRAAVAKDVAGRFNTGLIAANVDETKQLLALGPFTIEGVCTAAEATVTMKTSVDGASAYSDGGEFDKADFGTAQTLQLGYVADTTDNQVAFYNDDYNGWTAVSPGGESIFTGEAYSAKDKLGAPCSFLVTAEQLAEATAADAG